METIFSYDVSEDHSFKSNRISYESVAVAHLYERFLLCFLENPPIPNNVCDLRKTGLPAFKFRRPIFFSLDLIEMTDDSIARK